MVHSTNATTIDTDGDGLSDADEIQAYLTNPNTNDTDHDTFADANEITFGTNPNLMDTDGDGYIDGECILVQVVSAFFDTAQVVLGSVSWYQNAIVRGFNNIPYLPSVRYALRILVFKYFKFNEKARMALFNKLLKFFIKTVENAIGCE